MDYFEYFSSIKGPLLDGMTILLAGSGQYSSAELRAVLEQEGARVISLWKVGRPRSSQEAEAEWSNALRNYGTVDALITNFFSGGGPDSGDLPRMWAQNVEPVFHLCRLAAGYLKAQGAGRILNILSTNGKRPYLGASPAECAAAAAVIGLTKGWAEELAPYQVTANCLAAGLIRSEPPLAGKTFEEIQAELPMKWQPMQRLGSMEDVGNATAFLCSRYAGYVTGYTMDVNGGFYMD